MCKSLIVVAFILLLLLNGFSPVSAALPAKIVSGIVSNIVSGLVKWLWSLKSNAKTKTAVSSRSMMKFESGYSVETVFDGSKVGIKPYSVDVSPGGELLVLDSRNSNVYKISLPLSRYSKPKLIAGSPEGYSGHVDGKLREAKMNHPKGITVDDRGNIYVADTMNMAIRKISDRGVSTIAGGKWARGGGNFDDSSEDAEFSNDFDIVYVGTSCSLLIIDRGNQAIREIQLHDDDCNDQTDDNFYLGVALLVVAVFFGYMLALLLQRVGALFSFSFRDDPRTYMKKGARMTTYRRPPISVRPPLIPDEDELEIPDEGFPGEIFGGLSSRPRRKPLGYHQLQDQYQQQLEHSNPWPMQESFAIPDEDEPPALETRTPTSNETYPFTTKEVAMPQQFTQSHGYHNQQQKQMQIQHQRQQQQHQHRNYASREKPYYEKSCETNEIVFGAVQEQDGRREAVVIKAVDYADPRYNHRNVRPRFNYVGYSQGY